MYERAVGRLDGIRQMAHGGGVQQFGKLGVVFGTVHIGICGAVDYHLHVVVLHHGGNGLGVGDVEFGHVGEYISVTRVCGSVAQALPQLAVGTCHEYVHNSNGVSNSARTGCFLSLSERMASAGSICQSTPSDGSTMEMPPSASGW